jgi:hypothetical protein
MRTVRTNSDKMFFQFTQKPTLIGSMIHSIHSPVTGNAWRLMRHEMDLGSSQVDLVLNWPVTRLAIHWRQDQAGGGVSGEKPTKHC